MNKFIIKVILFFAIIAVFDFGYGLLAKYMISHAKSGDGVICTRILKNNQYDLMAMGSSRCVCHYDDRLLSDTLGINAVNAGYKGNGIILMYGRYHIIPKNQKPKVLLYDVEPCFDIIEYNDDNNRRYLSGLKAFYDEDGIDDIFRSVDCKEPIKMHSQMYRYNSELFNMLGNAFRNSNSSTSFYMPSYEQYVHAHNENTEKEAIVLDGLKLFYFEKLIKETKEDGVILVVVASPKYGAKDCEVLKPLIDLCEKQEIPFWNYYLDMHDTRWFCNDNHLNHDGALLFTGIIADRVKDEIMDCF